VPGVKVFAISEDHLSEAPFGLDTQGEQKSLDVYVEGIGPDKRLIEATPSLMDWAHALQANSLPARCKTQEEEIGRFFFAYRMDGIFTTPFRAYVCSSGKEK